MKKIILTLVFIFSISINMQGQEVIQLVALTT